jgi:hypothetical protein
MTERDEIEQQIREALATATSAILLSNQLFSPEGLFNQLATTQSERQVVVESALFKQAQQRLMVLRKIEAAEFARVVEHAQAGAPAEGLVLKLERAAIP